MPLTTYLLLFAAGIGAGIINTVAGGGSVLTIPALIFAGVPATSANATNRIGIIFQNLTAIRQFRRGGVSEFPLTWRVTIAGLAGAVIGAYLASLIPDDQFELVLGLIMLGLLPLTLKKSPKSRPRGPEESKIADHWKTLTSGRKVGTVAAFFLLGIYAGFLQAGIGIMILLVLVHYAGLTLVQANYVKLVYILVTMFMAFGIFLGQRVPIEWAAGAALTVGQMIGAVAGSWVAIKRGETWIRAIMVISIVLSSAKLLGLF